MIAVILKRMRSIRKQKNLTAKVVADRVGISRSFYTLLENGNRRLTVEMLLRICRALGVRASEILGE